MLKIRLIRTDGSIFKEQPIPMVCLHALRLIYFYDLMRKIENVEGDIVECGVGYGRSLFAFSLFSKIFNIDRHLYGFDSFQGLPEPSPEDAPEKLNIKKGHYSTYKEGVIRYLIYSGIDRDFINKGITLNEGYFSNTLDKYNGEGIALLHLDVDLYSSYKETLNFFYSKVVKRGIIAFDEYQAVDKFPGARKAIDEFLFHKKEKLIKSDIIDRYYVIKE